MVSRQKGRRTGETIEQFLTSMWPFKPKKQPILRVLSEELLGHTMEPCLGFGGMGTDVDTFAHYAVTYQDVETGKKHVDKVVRLAY